MNDEHERELARETLNENPEGRDRLRHKAREHLELRALAAGVPPEEIPEELVEELALSLLMRIQGNTRARMEELVDREQMERWVREETERLEDHYPDEAALEEAVTEAVFERMEREYPVLKGKPKRRRQQTGPDEEQL